MAFVNNFENDVFVSYAHADNEVDGLGDAWVHLFVQDLSTALKQRLGRGDEIKVYFDSRRLQGNHPLEEILNNVRRSALFLAIGSPSYINREWTLDELATFVGAMDDKARLFAIERLPLNPEERWPDPLNDYFRVGFWQRDQESDVPLTLTRKMKSDLYLIRVQKLAEQIRSQLVNMHNRHAAPEPAPDVDQQARKSGGSGKSTIGPVLIAQVTEDLETEREQLISYLSQYDIPILPIETYPQGGNDFKEAVAADLSRSGLFVQLLGPNPSRRPRDLPEGYLLAQSELAARAGVRIVQWRAPSLNLTAIADANHRAYLTGEKVAAVGFESFKAEVLKIATAPPPPPPRVAPAENEEGESGPIFINAAADDQPLATTVYEKVVARYPDTIMALPVGPAEEVRQDLERNWRECGSVVLIYGAASPFWVRNQMSMYNKLKPQRTQGPPRKFKILNCPPKEKPPVGMSIRGVDEEDLREGLSPEKVDKVVSDLLS